MSEKQTTQFHRNATNEEFQLYKVIEIFLRIIIQIVCDLNRSFWILNFNLMILQWCEGPKVTVFEFLKRVNKDISFSPS